jgi:hypothetical protein
MASARFTKSPPEDARDLARSPVADPYRGQLSDPFADRPVPEDVALFLPGRRNQVVVARPASSGPPLYASRRRAPTVVTTAGVIGLALGVLEGTLGLLVIALVNAVNGLAGGDRSFYRGRDASYILLGLLDFGAAVLLVAGAIALLGGRQSGRIALTAGGWVTIGFSCFWWTQDRVPWAIPAFMATSAVALLVLLYDAAVTRWLGVLPPPQPE